MTDRDTSPAFQALTPSAHRVLAFIERQIERGDGVAIISYSDFEVVLGITHGSIGFALRQVRLLGFVTVARTPARHRYVNTFRLSDHWQTIDADAAHRLAAQARLPQSRPVPKPRTRKRQTPSLATITLGDVR